MTRILLILAAAAALLASAPVAGAYTIGGARWPGSPARITYYDATPASYRWSVSHAAAAWNASGIRVQFVRVSSRAGARVVISRSAALAAGAGFATIGYAAGATIHLNMGTDDQWLFAGVVAHEMGHILGLGHVNPHSCATMTPVIWEGCKPVWPPHRWQWRCRLLQKDDLNGAKRLYGGTIHLTRSQWCDKAPLPPAVAGIGVVQLTASPVDVARVTVKLPRVAVGYVEILRRRTTCPKSPNDVLADSVGEVRGTPGSTHEIVDSQVPEGALAADSYCYRAFSVDEWGRAGASRTAMLDYTGPPPVPASDVVAIAPNTVPYPAEGQDPVLMDVTVTAPTASWLSEVEVVRKLGSCPASETDGTLIGSASTGAATLHVHETTLPDEGHWCVAAFTRDAFGRVASAGATEEIDYTQPRSPSPTGFTASGAVPGPAVNLSWAWPAGALSAILGREAGSCPVSMTVSHVVNDIPFDYLDPTTQSPAYLDDQFQWDAGLPLGTYCYALVTYDFNGYPSNVVLDDVTVS